MMSLRDFILSDANIYLAVYAVKSYVFDPQILCYEDKQLLSILMDPFDEQTIYRVIEEVKNIVEKIIMDENFRFETYVYFKPKEYNDGELIYRPIHTSGLKQLIAMVAVMHPLIYEIPDEDNKWKLNLSNYSRLIPNNFYGNRVSKKPEELFKNWNQQYKLYTQIANEYFKTYHETKEYKYELKLDLKNFFPSVNPIVIYEMLMKNIPVTLSSKDDIEVFKRIINKLLVCKVVNLNTSDAKERYYGKGNSNDVYTVGIAQGLPQSYFFGNICMIEISSIFDDFFKGKSVYYVDDSYIYTNEINENDFQELLNQVNEKIKEKMSEYIDRFKRDESSKNLLVYKFLNDKYKIEVHSKGKTTLCKIQDSKPGEIYLKTLSREASQIATDITATFSEDEDITMLERTEALLDIIEKERERETDSAYNEKLERYYKFFKYRQIKLKIKTNDFSLDKLFGVLLDETKKCNSKNFYKLLSKNEVSVKKFFENYKHDIWQAAMSILISNTVYDSEHDCIRQYIANIIDTSYNKELLDCSYIKKTYEDYINKKNLYKKNFYYTKLEKKVNQKLFKYANKNIDALKDEFIGIYLKDLDKDNILKSFSICSEKFTEVSVIVNMNSHRLKRMFLNAVYSKIFKVSLSDDLFLSSYDKKGITYGELRVLSYLRNNVCDIDKFFKWEIEPLSPHNMQKIDYTIFEVISLYKRYVIVPDNIDNLINVHKYTCDVWKNGAKHLYFYTLHNQEHAVDLAKNIVKIVKTFSYFRITKYDYYILFLACYLHDISMVRIASENDFLLDKNISEKIVAEIEGKWNLSKCTSDIKKVVIDNYKAVDYFFEDKIRSSHARDSAKEIRKRKELEFLDQSLRECVAEISESHTMDVQDIYFVKGDAKNRLVSYKFDKILLRFADLLDMSEHRVSKPILNHNIDNMSLTSAFHWVSHLLTDGYDLISKYKINSDFKEKSCLTPGSITEEINLSIYVNLSQFSAVDSKKCKCAKLCEETLSSNGFTIKLLPDKEICDSGKCNFLCRWFNEKNGYLVQEMQALNAYLNRVPLTDRFYNTEIVINIIVKNPTDIPDDQFDVLKKQLFKE